MNSECDVLVIGGGMAGSCMALQLKSRMPQLSVTLVEKKKKFDYWVGESTVEMWDDYMTRVLGLGPYLEKHTMQKHGLRFFFDNKEKSLELEQMSEMGRSQYHAIPARQIDRQQFDEDMMKILQDRGVDVRRGVSVLADTQENEGIQINGKDGHTVRTDEGLIGCKYLIDAGGMRSPLVQKLDLRVKNTELRKGSYWSRYKNINNLDGLGSNCWRKRVRYTQRHLSTNHFMYRGYWMWLIVIDPDTVSIGVEFDRNQNNIRIKNGEQFDAWLREHRVFDQILGTNCEQVDFFGLMNIAYTSKQFVSDDRWYLTGMAGAFSSVLGSSTSRAYSTSNVYIESIIRSDMDGKKDEVQRMTSNINEQLKSNYESSVRFLNNLDRNGSFDTWAPFFNASLALYFNSSLPAATNLFANEIESAKTNDMSGAMCWSKNDQVLLRIKIAALADEFKVFLDEEDQFYQGNEGMFVSSSIWEEYPEIHDKIYEKRDKFEETRISKVVYRYLVSAYVEKMCDLTGQHFDISHFDRIFLDDWKTSNGLDYYYDAMRVKQSAY